MIVVGSSEGKEILLPSEVSEIKLANFIAYSKVMEGFDQNTDGNHIMTMCRALSELTGTDVGEFLNLPLSQEDPARTQGMLQIFAHYSKVLGAFSPSAEFFNGTGFVYYRGEHWRLPKAIGGNMAMTTVTTAEAVEALEAGRIIQATIEKNGDETGSALFTNYLSLLAALLRKGGEVLPAEDMAREAFIKERIEYFADVTMDIALNVDFFLLSFMKPYAQTVTIVGSLSQRVFEHLALGTLTLSVALLTQQKQGQKKHSAGPAGAP